MAKKPTYEELQAKIDFYEYSVDENRKVVRKALREHKIWKPELHENEVAAITAVFLATKQQLDEVSAELMKLKAMPELTTKPAEALTVFIDHANVNNIMITDYGGDVDLQINSNKLAYRESNVLVANFAKV